MKYDRDIDITAMVVKDNNVKRNIIKCPSLGKVMSSIKFDGYTKVVEEQCTCRENNIKCDYKYNLNGIKRNWPKIRQSLPYMGLARGNDAAMSKRIKDMVVQKEKFSECPSCFAEGMIDIYGVVLFKHEEYCQMGNLYVWEDDKKCCNKCAKITAITNFPPNYRPWNEDAWLAINECPICWNAEKERNMKTEWEIEFDSKKEPQWFAGNFGRDERDWKREFKKLEKMGCLLLKTSGTYFICDESITVKLPKDKDIRDKALLFILTKLPPITGGTEYNKAKDILTINWS